MPKKSFLDTLKQNKNLNSIFQIIKQNNIKIIVIYKDNKGSVQRNKFLNFSKKIVTLVNLKIRSV